MEQELQELAGKLFDFARTGQTAQLAQYLDHGVPVDLANQNGDTFVMLAAYKGHAETVAMLAARGADVNKLNDRGQSPLAGAIFKKEEAVIEALIEAGASPTAGTPSAVDTATLFGQSELAERLSQLA
ncbi:ankyrin repeat domain-containing protein [Corynebacterium sp. ZY180755]